MNRKQRGKREKSRSTRPETAFEIAVVFWIIAVMVVVGMVIVSDASQGLTPQPTYVIEPHDVDEVIIPPTETPEVTPEPTVEPTPEPTETPEPEPQRVYYDCPFDQAMQDYIYDCMEQFNINIEITWPLAMVWNESRFDQYACGAANDKGYLQLIPGTYQAVYAKVTKAYPELNLVDDVYNPYTNVACALYYMQMVADGDGLEEINTSNMHHILTCYNRGPGGGWSYYRNHGTWESGYSQRIEAIAAIIFEDGTIANINDKLR